CERSAARHGSAGAAQAEPFAGAAATATIGAAMRGWVGFAFALLIGLGAFLVWRDFETWRALNGANAEISADLRDWLEVNERGLLVRDAFDTTRYDKII